MPRTRALVVAVSAAAMLLGSAVPAGATTEPADALVTSSPGKVAKQSQSTSPFGSTASSMDYPEECYDDPYLCEGWEEPEYCYDNPEIVSMTVTPPALKIGTYYAKTNTFRVGVRDDCNLAPYMLFHAERASINAEVEAYMDWENDGWADDNGIFWATITVTADPLGEHFFNAKAGTWTWYAAAEDDWEALEVESGPNFYLQRNSTLTTNAAPEPVRKGGTITITGDLRRANWELSRYMGYTGQTVKVQQRPAAGGAYVDLKLATTNASGIATVKVVATKDLCFRYVFAGTTTTPAVTSSGDCVDVV